MSNQHTPGPWTAHKNRLNRDEWHVASPKRYPAFTVLCGTVEAEANARLIAAAPELLAELVASVERLEELRDRHLLHAAAVTRALVQKRIDAARVAIAKATGEDSRQ